MGNIGTWHLLERAWNTTSSLQYVRDVGWLAFLSGRVYDVYSALSANSVSTPIMTSTSQNRASKDLLIKLNDLLGCGFEQPSGSLSAKIGFVSGFIPNDEATLGEEARQSQPNLHRGFRDMDFNEANSLAWAFDFCKRRQLQTSSFKSIKTGSPLANNIALAHQLFIKKSEISIIFLCGPDAEL